ncbi:TetR family transcriptional regulator [Amycolatopsis sp. 195334CR]|uniref:TetR family transcriptional regulator n=1 Tax=Amycolatopsis sp. 195334CR TaxID=2814588 RepID=UPI001A906CF5|nr:TetR family transcriptional regulator [Amycolatopsis sp. 195334CR]MBN6040451.1 TetR family transcriptional regulator [Amycolatopsis sp. 195334CR]
MSTTPQRILAAARALFAEHGYRATSMQAIADQLGITKAALYYHFDSKDELLRHLTLPLLDELEGALNDAETAGDPEAVRWRAIEGYVDVHLRHRETLLMLVRDMTLLVQAPVADRFRAAIALANDLIRGPEHDLAQRVRAAQVVAGLADPVVLFLDEPPEQVKRLILDGARALLATPAEKEEPAGTRPRGRPRGRSGGRPAALTEPDAQRARDLYAAGHPAQVIADRLGVSRATVYRCLKTSAG